MRMLTRTLVLCLLSLPCVSTSAQEASLQWMTDLETAQAAAKQSGRLVLVHFWTPDCKPCETLERGVFNQPHVVATIEQQFVVVKINALEARNTADAYGVTRVPTDVILSSQGEVLNRSISPNSPMAYIAHLTQIASAQQQGPGSGFDQAVAQAPAKQITNPAYAGLNIPAGGANNAAGASTALASTATTATAPAAASPPSAATAIANPYAAASPAAAPGQQVTPEETASAAGPVSAPRETANATPPIGDRYAMNSSVVASPMNNPYASIGAAQPANVTAAPVQQIPLAPMPAGAAGGELASNPINPPSAAGTAPTSSAAQQPAPPTAAMPVLPPGSPPLGFDGFCPVTMKREWKWRQGDVRFGVVHRGRTYLFTNQACRDEFLANPDTYSPALSGLDPVLQLEQGQSVPGKRQFAVEYKGQFYMFSSEQTLNRFWQHADQYATGARQAMQPGQGRMVR